MSQAGSLARGHSALSLFFIIIILLFCAISIVFWRRVVIETQQTVAGQVDYEDALLCSKFGFPRGTEKHNACKLDLLDLRRRDEELMAQTSLP
jgi:hypothetical protein